MFLSEEKYMFLSEEKCYVKCPGCGVFFVFFSDRKEECESNAANLAWVGCAGHDNTGVDRRLPGGRIDTIQRYPYGTAYRTATTLWATREKWSTDG
jgi:hypothetical protein